MQSFFTCLVKGRIIGRLLAYGLQDKTFLNQNDLWTVGAFIHYLICCKYKTDLQQNLLPVYIIVFGLLFLKHFEHFIFKGALSNFLPRLSDISQLEFYSFLSCGKKKREKEGKKIKPNFLILRASQPSSTVLNSPLSSGDPQTKRQRDGKMRGWENE